MPLAHQIRLKPKKQQLDYLTQAAGTRRFVWNWALGQVIKQIQELKAKEGLREKLDSCAELKIQFNAIKYAEFPWIKDVHRDAHAQPFADLAKALTRFYEGKAEFPQFKAKNHAQKSFYVANDKLSIGVHKGSPAVKLPKIGWVDLSEYPRFKGRILNATISEYGGKDQWYISFCFEETIDDFFKDLDEEYKLPGNRSFIEGLDINTKEHYTSNGKIYKVPEKLKKLQTKIKVLQNKLSHKVETSAKTDFKNAKKMWGDSTVPFSVKDFYGKNIIKLTDKIRGIHAQIQCIRTDFIHKMTTDIVQSAEIIGIEDLNVKGMTASAKGTVEDPGKNVKQKSGLNRAILNVAPYRIKQQLLYKATKYGTCVIVVGRWFASSKKCSTKGCHYVNQKLKLKDRHWTCPCCGSIHHRDENASKNIRNEALRLWIEQGGSVPGAASWDLDTNQPSGSEWCFNRSIKKLEKRLRLVTAKPKASSKKTKKELQFSEPVEVQLPDQDRVAAEARSLSPDRVADAVSKSLT